MTREQELEEKIKVLEQLPGEGEQELVAQYREELVQLRGKKEVTQKMTTDFELPMTEEEFLAAGSKFAEAGEHVSECGMPDWETPGKSIKFPFTIIEGSDSGKEGKIVAGVTAGAAWKLKEVLSALGVQHQVHNGKVRFAGADCAGKRFLSVWTTQIDTRLPEEGGKGGTYTKPTGALPLGAKSEELNY